MSDERIGVVINTTLQEQLFTPADRAALEALAPVVWADQAERLTLDQAQAILAECTIGIGSWGSPHPGSEGLLAACPKLRLWEHVAGSVKAFFNEHSADRELVVASCKGAIADCVAEMTLGEIIIGLRQIWPNAHANRKGRSGKPANMKVLQTATVGVVGASEVGKRVIALLRQFSCRILIYDPFLSAEQAQALGGELADDLVEMCSQCDAVTIHTPKLPSTEGLLSAAHFKAMADDTVFVNTSRGCCIDEQALISELQAGRLFAFLDVSNPEPAADDSPLRQLDNVVLTTHVAGPATYNMGQRCVADVRAFLQGEAPQCVITADMLERIA